MPFCKKCGSSIDEAAKFCPKCGSIINETQSSATQPNSSKSDIGEKIKNLNNTEDNTSEFDAEDIKKSKVYAVLAYIPLLNLITLFGSKDSKYAKYHLNQGLILVAIEAAWSILASIMNGFIGLIMLFTFGLSVVLNVILTIVSVIIGIALLILIIIGIVNAATDKAKKLPVIGKFN